MLLTPRNWCRDAVWYTALFLTFPWSEAWSIPNISHTPQQFEPHFTHLCITESNGSHILENGHFNGAIPPIKKGDERAMGHWGWPCHKLQQQSFSAVVETKLSTTKSIKSCLSSTKSQFQKAFLVSWWCEQVRHCDKRFRQSVTVLWRKLQKVSYSQQFIINREQ